FRHGGQASTDTPPRRPSCAGACPPSSSGGPRAQPVSREERRMRGKNVLMESLLAHGVEYIFGNPGTTESPILDALLDYPRLRYVVTLHEGVALGAASYYALTSGKTGVVNVHVAPGLGNAL